VTPIHLWSAQTIAARVRAGEVTAAEIVEAALDRIAGRGAEVNAFTEITAVRAMALARKIDSAVARREDPGPLAGVPFAVKNLFDVRGVVTLAGSIIERRRPPAALASMASYRPVVTV
jgi:aspartyl-tRNA(Asn)/glutamyl-tRNA(Gln) amidotransferase subunit A